MSWFDTLADGASSLTSAAADTVSEGASTLATGASDLATSTYHDVATAATAATASPTAALNAFAHYADELSIVPKGAVDGAHLLGKGINAGVDWMEDNAHKGAVEMAKATEGIPVLAQVGQGLGFLSEHTTGFLGGTVRGVTGMAEGLVDMAAHPTQTAVGLGTLGYHMLAAQGDQLMASYETLTGHEDAALARMKSSEHVQYNTAVGKAFAKPIADAWNKGRYGDAAGQTSVQLAAILMGLGEGEAGEAANLGRTADVRTAGELGELAEGAELDPVLEIGEVNPGIGSNGKPFDPSHVPKPGEPVSWPPNNGGIGPPAHETLPPGTKLDRIGSPQGGYFAPEGTPMSERALPPKYGPDGKIIFDDQYFYEVGPDGLPVEKNAIAPAFDQPGGGVQYQAPKVNPADRWNPNAEGLVNDGKLIETQRNQIRELEGPEADEVRRIAEQHGA